MTLHVVDPGSRVGRTGDRLVVQGKETKQEFPIQGVGAIVLHGFSQISSQALRSCAEQEIGVFWASATGNVYGALAPVTQSPQRHLRQFEALSDEAKCLDLAKRLVEAKIELQVAFVLRSSRGGERAPEVSAALGRMRRSLSQIAEATDRQILLGYEGEAAAAYFSAIPSLLSDDLDLRMRFGGRSKRPSRDRFNVLLNFGYGMLYREVMQALLVVGLHPGIGFYHQPRSAAPPLILDLMEMFRVPMVDIPLVGAINRKTFDADSDFVESAAGVWLSAAGRKKAVVLFERRKQDEWKHPVAERPLSYARLVEFEARLLEKDFCDEGQLFAQLRLR